MLLSFALLAFACNNTKNGSGTTPGTEIKLDKSSARLTTPDATTVVVDLVSDAEWTTLIESPEGTSWLSIDPKEGPASPDAMKVSINVTANDTDEERTARITFAHKAGNVSTVFELYQSPLLTALGRDSIVLVEFYNALEGWNWKNFPWDLDEPVQTWFGVTIGVVNGEPRVTKLDIQSQGAKGALPESIKNLDALRVFMSYKNNLTDGAADAGFPEFFTELPLLTELYLASSNFTGAIPESYYGMTKLRQMDLSGNSITAPLSDKIGQMVNLTQIDLSNTGLTGNLPATIKNMSELLDINVDGCKLTGPLTPELGECPKLANLNFTNNPGLTGGIPAEWGNMDSLAVILLSECTGIDGTLPGSLAQCKNWWELRISNTRITGNIPDEWKNAPSLNLIQAFSCKLSGELPRWENIPPSMEYLNLSNHVIKDQQDQLGWNEISGTLPNFIGQLKSFSIAHNKVTGALPEGLTNSNTIAEVNLGFNELAGEIPQSFWKNNKLTMVILSENKGLTGTFPQENDAWSGRTMTVLSVDGCQMSGEIPAGIFTLNDLNTLLLKNNNFTGTLPGSTFGKASLLSNFSVSGNRLTGEFPVAAGTHDNFSNWDPAVNVCPQQAPYGFEGNSCTKYITAE